MGHGFTFRGEESGVFSAAVKSLPLVLKGKRSCFCQGEKSTVPLCVGPQDVGCLIDMHLETTYIEVTNSGKSRYKKSEFGSSKKQKWICRSH